MPLLCVPTASVTSLTLRNLVGRGVTDQTQCQDLCTTASNYHFAAVIGGDCYCDNGAPSYTIGNRGGQKVGDSSCAAGSTAIWLRDERPGTDWVFQHCLTDTAARILPPASNDPDFRDFTYASCFSECAMKGYKLAGLEFSGQCFCGNDYAATTPVLDNAMCSGTCFAYGAYNILDTTQLCGATWTLALFQNNAVSSVPLPPSTSTSTSATVRRLNTITVSSTTTGNVISTTTGNVTSTTTGNVTSTTTGKVTSTTTGNATSSSTTTKLPPKQVSGDSSSTQGLSHGALAAIVVASVLVLLVGIASGILWFIYRKKNHRRDWHNDEFSRYNDFNLNTFDAPVKTDTMYVAPLSIPLPATSYAQQSTYANSAGFPSTGTESSGQSLERPAAKAQPVHIPLTPERYTEKQALAAQPIHAPLTPQTYTEKQALAAQPIHAPLTPQTYTEKQAVAMGDQLPDYPKNEAPAWMDLRDKKSKV